MNTNGRILTDDTLQTQLNAALALVAKLQADKKGTIRLKVSDKGALSIYGLGSRFPATLYREQWEKVLDMADEIREFMEENAKELKTR